MNNSSLAVHILVLQWLDDVLSLQQTKKNVQKCFQPPELASVAQSDARLNGDQAVAGSIPEGSGSILSLRVIRVILSSADSRRTVVSILRKNVHKYWLTA